MSDNPEALRRAIECIRALADQQAMPDDFWKAEVSALEAVLAQQAATPTDAGLLAALEGLLAIHTEPAGYPGKFGKELDRFLDEQQKKIDAKVNAARAAIAAARQAATPAPAGWKLVPIEPTEEMLAASLQAHVGRLYPQDGVHGPKAKNRNVYATMIAAAPPATPAAQPAEEVMDMALCESAACVLRIGQLYRFRPVGDCKTCADMKRAADEAYGPAPAAPAAPQEEA